MKNTFRMAALAAGVQAGSTKDSWEEIARRARARARPEH